MNEKNFMVNDQSKPDLDAVTLPDLVEEPTRARVQKAADAFRTISEVADELHVPQHVLRFWESKFPQVRPLKRGGGRRYYRPEDVALLRRVAELLYTNGYTIKGVQRLLKETSSAPVPLPEIQELDSAPAPVLEFLEPQEPEIQEPEIQEPEQVLSALADVVAAVAREFDESTNLRGVLLETLTALEDIRRALD